MGQTSTVEGDPAYGSQANMQMALKRNVDDPARRWSFMFAIARTGYPLSPGQPPLSITCHEDLTTLPEPGQLVDL